MNTETPDRLDVISAYLGIDASKIYRVTNAYFEVHDNGTEYLVLTDEEADIAVRKCIEDDLWLLNDEFVARMTDLPVELFRILSERNGKANGLIRQLVDKTCGMDRLVAVAIEAYGRAHFIGRGDSGVQFQGYFIYRCE